MAKRHSEERGILNATEKAELRRLLDKVEPFDPGRPEAPFDLGENPPPGLLEALEYVEAHGIGTGASLRAVKCRGDSWLIDSRIMADLRRLAS